MEIPVRQGGMGVESQEDLITAAFVGGLEQALPYFGGEDGICPALGQLVDVGAADRYRPLLETGNRTGKELDMCWGRMRKEVEQSYVFLGEEETLGVLSAEAATAGQGSTSSGGR